jgi:hypothetical protein
MRSEKTRIRVAIRGMGTTKTERGKTSWLVLKKSEFVLLVFSKIRFVRSSHDHHGSHLVDGSDFLDIFQIFSQNKGIFHNFRRLQQFARRLDIFAVCVQTQSFEVDFEEVCV